MYLNNVWIFFIKQSMIFTIYIYIYILLSIQYLLPAISPITWSFRSLHMCHVHFPIPSISQASLLYEFYEVYSISYYVAESP